MLTVSETMKYTVLCTGMLLAAQARTSQPHLAVAGAGLLVSMACLGWFWHPVALSKAYEHMALTYTGQFALLRHLR
jgi:hypothetical protein